MSTVPSPQSTFVAVIEPSGSEDVTETVTVWPVVGEVGDTEKLITGGRSETVTGEDDEVVEPLLSVTVTVIVKIMLVADPVEVKL